MVTFLLAEQMINAKEEIVKLKEFEVFKSIYEETRSSKFQTMKNHVSSGIYLYKMKTGKFTDLRG